jgi:hypothetical protein
MLKDCSDKKNQKNFINGIKDLEDYTLDNYKQDFLKCSNGQRNEIMRHFEQKAMYSSSLLNKVNNKLFGKPFFTQLKDLTTEGFCISEIGATQAMAYDYIPGSYEACIPLKHNQKAWATK